MRKNKETSNLKNWIEVFILVVIVVGITFYLCSWYKNYKKESMSNFVLEDVVKQIKKEELKPYLLENTDSYVYICVIDDNDCREFETEIKPVLEKSKIKDYVIYLNLTEEENKKEVIDTINKEYGTKKKKIDSYPAFVRIKDGKIVSMVNKTNKKLTKHNFERYLDINEIS